MREVIAIFDIGKTNKKYILFDLKLNLISVTEVKFREITDSDGDPCDDIAAITEWVYRMIMGTIDEGIYSISAINFSTYGASFIHIDSNGEAIIPLYNYLKEIPLSISEDIYSRYGGEEQFCRETASPPLSMLNSGFQLQWLAVTKPDIWSKIDVSLHFPNYLSFIYSGKIVSDYTSIGCHTALWDYDNMRYHKWLESSNISLPEPVSNRTHHRVSIKDQDIDIYIGIHDSSASLIPYMEASKGAKFILVSSGTWAINMNPFSKEPLTLEELREDSLSFLTIDKDRVKASRLFMGHIHEVNATIIADHFNCSQKEYTTVTSDIDILKRLYSEESKPLFYGKIPDNYLISSDSLKQFNSYSEAYHQLMYELTLFEIEAIKLVMDSDDSSETIFISGGFAKNSIFIKVLEDHFPGKRVVTANIDNASALGAAIITLPSDSEIDYNSIIPNLDIDN